MEGYADETAIEADGVIDEVLQLLTSTDPEDRIEAAGVMCLSAQSFLHLEYEMNKRLRWHSH